MLMDTDGGSDVGGDGIMVNNKYLSLSESQSLPRHHERADDVVC